MSEEGTSKLDPNPMGGTGEVPSAQPKDRLKVYDSDSNRPLHNPSRIPQNSIFYKRVVPALLLAMALVMLILILVAVGVLVGMVPFQ